MTLTISTDEYSLPSGWRKTFPLSEAKTFAGVFASQNIVCKLRNTAAVVLCGGSSPRRWASAGVIEIQSGFRSTSTHLLPLQHQVSVRYTKANQWRPRRNRRSFTRSRWHLPSRRLLPQGHGCLLACRFFIEARRTNPGTASTRSIPKMEAKSSLIPSCRCDSSPKGIV